MTTRIAAAVGERLIGHLLSHLVLSLHVIRAVLPVDGATARGVTWKPSSGGSRELPC
jgi:hypothetical protein